MYASSKQELYDYLVEHNNPAEVNMPIGSPRRPERDISPEDVCGSGGFRRKMQANRKGTWCFIGSDRSVVGTSEEENIIPISVHNYASIPENVSQRIHLQRSEEMATIATPGKKATVLVKYGRYFCVHGAKDMAP